METEKKYTWALTGLIVMILLNAGTLFTIWMNNPDGRDWRKNHKETEERGSAHQYMKKELGLNEAQADSMTALRRTHFREVRELRRNLNEMRRRYFDMLMNPETGTEVSRDSLVQDMAKQYIAIEQSMHQHMQEMNSLLNEEQQEKFGRMMKDMFMNHRGSKDGRRHQR